MSAKKIIKEGDHVVMKRDNSYSIMQVRLNRHVSVDKHKFKLNGMVGCPYGSRFEVKNEVIVQVDRSARDFNIPECGKGVDNRNIVGKDSNQQLSHEEIMAMKKDGLTGESIVGRLIENSSTFSLKTEYAQDKYIKKKKRKYMLIFVALRPTTRILVEMYFAKGPARICHMRIDSLAQVLMLGNTRADTNVAVVDTCLGIVVGAVMERLGGLGNVIHIYHGRNPSRPAVDCYDFDQDHMDTLHSFPMEKLNLLKHTGNVITDEDLKAIATDDGGEPKEKVVKLETVSTDPDVVGGNKETAAPGVGAAVVVKPEVIDTEKVLNPELSPEHTSDSKGENKNEESVNCEGKSKNDDSKSENKNEESVNCEGKSKNDDSKSENKNEESVNCEGKSKNDDDTDMTDSKMSSSSLEGKQSESVDGVDGAKAAKKRFRETFGNREAKRESVTKRLAVTQSLLVNKELDCILIASKFYPTPLVLNLLPYLRPSRQIVVYSQYKESLLECYAQLREIGGLVNFRLTETWLREYQVLPMRTHPLVNMSGTGGYLLVATTVMKT